MVTPRPGAPTRAAVLRTSVVPLASIFGSGFLIVVPILERTLGALAAVGMAAVCALAWLVGSAIRHNVAEVEARAHGGELDAATRRLERASDLSIVVAYVISVALYLRILAQFVVEYGSSGSDVAERLVAVALIGAITAVGLARGLDGLEFLERVALAAVLVLIVAVIVTFAGKDASLLAAGDLELPPVPDLGLGTVLLALGGIVITVQGFETIRYLEDRADRPTRIAACRASQGISTVVYVAFVVLATPLMGLGTQVGSDADLLGLIERVAPVLALPLVLCAVLSQFSAATADTEAGVGNLAVLGWEPLQGRAGYVVLGGVAVVLAATVATDTIVVVASRAFALYYALQCVIAVRTSARPAARAVYGLLAAVMLAITLLATPAG